MRYSAIILVLLKCILANAQQPLQPIASWREHLPYNSAIDVTEGDGKIYCATPYSIFSVDPASQVIERMSKVTGLSETGISTILYDNINKKLFIAYSNSNIDIITENKLNNIPDIKRDNIIGNRSIYQVYALNKNYFLSTGLGVIIIDGENYEVKDTWFIGDGGNQVKVNGFASDVNFFYAATEEGLKRASINGPDPADYVNWQVLSGAGGLTNGPCRNVINVNGNILIEKNDSLFTYDGSNWTLFYTDGWPIISSNISNGKILLCQRKISGESRVLQLNINGVIERTITQAGVISLPRKAIIGFGDPWIADQFGGLSHFTANSFQQYKPNSPQAIASGEMIFYNNKFYATAGAVNDSWNYQYNGDGIFIFTEGNWTNINRFTYPQLDSLLDIITIKVDPVDETIWAGSYGGGLLHISPGPQFEIIKQGILESAVGDPGSYRVSGIAFDNENQLWVSNYGSPQPLMVRKRDGNWIKYSAPFFLHENAIAQIIVDDNNYKWIVSPKENGLICYDHGASVENSGDDRWKLFRAGAGNGNLPANELFCVTKDRNGYIWAGTADGIGVIQCPGEVFTAQGCEAILPIVQQGNFAGFLFKGETVRDIAVDGADRKWIATPNGVWLISPDGTETIYQFTETNSPLLSNDVRKIAIDGKTGEVYFATTKGICSFRSTATEGELVNTNLLVFPNPVPPGYTGIIGIRGVAENAIVKITELNGRLVYQTRALGGQAVWDGRDYRGRKISSGIYLVLISDDAKSQKASTKIIFLDK